MDNNNLGSSLNIGDMAPDFSLENQKGEQITLAEVLADGKKVLLVFYPGDMTPGCTTQLCGIRDVYKDYQDLGVKVFGVNHADKKSHQKFIDAYGYQFDILVDEGREVAKKYKAMKKFLGHDSTKRGVFLINTDSTIMYSIWGQQNNQEILQILKSNN